MLETHVSILRLTETEVQVWDVSRGRYTKDRSQVLGAHTRRVRSLQSPVACLCVYNRRSIPSDPQMPRNLLQQRRTWKVVDVEFRLWDAHDWQLLSVAK